MSETVSIVVPVLDEAEGVEACLRALRPFREQGADVVVVDGGSRDATRALAAPLADRVIEAPRGRASQMNAGAAACRGDIVVFLHADTLLPPDALAQVRALGPRAWGRFDVAISGGDARLAIVAAFMNLRSRLTGIATGDQAIFVRRAAFERVGGYPAIALMEDVEISRRLKALSRPHCVPSRATTSARRWQRHGVLRTILLMWRLRLAYWRGADPADLAKRYG